MREGGKKILSIILGINEIAFMQERNLDDKYNNNSKKMLFHHPFKWNSLGWLSKLTNATNMTIGSKPPKEIVNNLLRQKSQGNDCAIHTWCAQ